MENHHFSTEKLTIPVAMFSNLVDSQYHGLHLILEMISPPYSPTALMATDKPKEMGVCRIFSSSTSRSRCKLRYSSDAKIACHHFILGNV